MIWVALKMSKKTTDALPSINIKQISIYSAASGSAQLRYTKDGKPFEHTVYFAQTACNYGGVRYWFRCEGCQRRVGVLYLSGGQFACRHCFSLAYKSERENSTYRLYRKADKIRVRLGWGAGVALLSGGKPKGMHWKTFYRMKAKQDDTAQLVLESTAQLYNDMFSRLQRQFD